MSTLGKQTLEKLKISNRKIWFYECRETNPWYIFHIERRRVNALFRNQDIQQCSLPDLAEWAVEDSLQFCRSWCQNNVNKVMMTPGRSTWSCQYGTEYHASDINVLIVAECHHFEA